MRGRGYKRHHNARTPSGVQRTSTPDDTLLFKNIDGPRKNRVAAKKNTLKIILTGYLWGGASRSFHRKLPSHSTVHLKNFLLDQQLKTALLNFHLSFSPRQRSSNATQ
jgi:hypothetical protein